MKPIKPSIVITDFDEDGKTFELIVYGNVKYRVILKMLFCAIHKMIKHYQEQIKINEQKNGKENINTF